MESENLETSSSSNKNYKIFLILGGLLAISLISYFMFAKRKYKKKSKKQAKKIRRLEKRLMEKRN
jgi:hypothetical protein